MILKVLMTLGVLAFLALSITRANTASGQERSPWPAPTSDSLRGQVTYELARNYADLSARDWTAFADHFWPGATLTTIWTPPGEVAPGIETITVPEFVRNASKTRENARESTLLFPHGDSRIQPRSPARGEPGR